MIATTMRLGQCFKIDKKIAQVTQLITAFMEEYETPQLDSPGGKHGRGD